MSNQIRKGAFISYTTIAINILLGLLYTPWMIDKIGVSDYGLYALISAFLSYFILDFGLGEAIARFLALAVANKDSARIKSIINSSIRIYLLIDLGIFLTLCIIYCYLNNIFGNLTDTEQEKLHVIFCIAGFFSILSFPLMPLNGILIANERFVCIKTCDLVQKTAIALLSIIAILLSYGLYTIILIHGLSGLLTGIYKAYYARSYLNLKINLRDYNSSTIKSLFKFSFFVFVIGIAQRLTVNICPTILGIQSTTLQITIFSIASALEAHTWTFANALNGLFLPKVAKLSLKDSSQVEITNLMIKIGRLQLLIIGLLISCFFVVGQSFIKLWVGEAFQSAYYITLLMILPSLITLTQSIAQTLLYVKNEIRYRAIIFICSSIISFIVSYTLSPKYGAIGCGIGIGISILACHIIGMNIVYAKILKLDILLFFKECHRKILSPIILIAALSLFITIHLVTLDSWFKLFLFVSIYTALYSLTMWFAVLNKSEQKLIKGILHKI